MEASRPIDDPGLRRGLEDRTEDVLYLLYDEVAPVLAATFAELRRAADRELENLLRVAESLSLPTNGVREERSEGALQRIVWQPVARSTVLFLFSSLVAQLSVNDTRQWSLLEWVRDTVDRLDRELFVEQTALPEADVDLAFGVAARAIAESAAISKWEFLLFEGRPLLLRADASGIAVTGLSDLPVGLVEVNGALRIA